MATMSIPACANLDQSHHSLLLKTQENAAMSGASMAASSGTTTLKAIARGLHRKLTGAALTYRVVAPYHC